MNPPYSQTAEWCGKAFEEIVSDRAVAVVGLLPANPDTGWFHDFVLPWTFWVRRHRIHFRSPEGGSRRNPKGSVLTVWTKRPAIVERLQTGLKGSRWRCNSPNTIWDLANCNGAAGDQRASIRASLWRIQKHLALNGSYTSPVTGRTITRLGNPCHNPALHLIKFAGSPHAADARRQKADEFAVAVFPTVLHVLGEPPWEGVSFAALADELQRRGVPTSRRSGSWNRGTVVRLLDRLRRLLAEGRLNAPASSRPPLPEASPTRVDNPGP